MTAHSKRVVVFSGTTVEADLVQLHLLDEGIDAILEHEHVGTWVPYAAPGGGAGAVSVSVSIVDEAKAKQFIERHHRPM